MIYTVHNTHRASVFDVATKQKINFVLEVDTDAALLQVERQPIEIAGSEPVRDTVNFKRICPIFGGHPMPQMFLCFS